MYWDPCTAFIIHWHCFVLGVLGDGELVIDGARWIEGVRTGNIDQEHRMLMEGSGKEEAQSVDCK